MTLSNTTGYIPTDIFYAVLEHLTDRRDLYAAALANRDFNRAATPLLYRTLDTDTRAGRWGHKTVRSFHFNHCSSSPSYSITMPDDQCNPPGIYPPSKARTRSPRTACS